MKTLLMTVGALLTALAVGVGAATAADSPPWGAGQLASQSAGTEQGAPSLGSAGQLASNASLPSGYSTSAAPIGGASSSATQTADNSANGNASNSSSTAQTANATQTGGSSSCLSGCGGAGQSQVVDQSAVTKQDADAKATAPQDAVNANVPVSIAGGSVLGGSSSATQTADNSADASASNTSNTTQNANPTQTGGSSSCLSGCGGNGQSQTVDQSALTKQDADADAKAKQTAVNANVPVSIAGHDVVGGSSSATQTAGNTADATAANMSGTTQTANPTQTGGSSSCFSGCGGNGQEQNVIQASGTKQDADADATAKQDAVNANVPVGIAGYDVVGGSSSATQTTTNDATSNASNTNTTNQTANPSQTGGSSSCLSGCGGNGQEQNVFQVGLTKQDADASSLAKQDAVNANTPISIAGKNVYGGSSSAAQTASNNATANAPNTSTTDQTANPSQLAGSLHCWSGCGGNGQEQNVFQIALTKQDADAKALAKQDAVNANTPVAVSGGNVYGGSSSATQTATNNATANAPNSSATHQVAELIQKSGDGWCWSGCGGQGQEQNLIEEAKTKQNGKAKAWSPQMLVNSDVPLSEFSGRKEKKGNVKTL